MTSSNALTRLQILAQSWPIILANALAPIVGFVDIFVIGRFTDTTSLAAIGLGAAIFGMVYWGFGFLRMSTTGLTAQSEGEGARSDVQAHLLRAVPMGLAIGFLILVLQAVLLYAAFAIYTAPEAIERSAAIYLRARLWGLPAILGGIALSGWFIGLGQTRQALRMQITLNLINISLSLYFVIDLEWGLYGVGLATSLAEWAGLFTGLYLARRLIHKRGGWEPAALTRKALLNPAALRKLGVANGNIFIRALTLTLGFNFFTNAAAGQGDVFLAATNIHLQFITLSALILDAFAATAEAVAGAAYGTRNQLGCLAVI